MSTSRIRGGSVTVSTRSITWPQLGQQNGSTPSVWTASSANGLRALPRDFRFSGLAFAGAPAPAVNGKASCSAGRAVLLLRVHLRHHERPQLGARRQHAVVDDLVHPGPRDERHQARHEVERREEQRLGPVAPRMTQPHLHPAVREQRQPLVRQRRPQDIATQSRQALTIPRAHPHPGVQIPTVRRPRPLRRLAPARLPTSSLDQPRAATPACLPRGPAPADPASTPPHRRRAAARPGRPDPHSPPPGSGPGLAADGSRGSTPPRRWPPPPPCSAQAGRGTARRERGPGRRSGRTRRRERGVEVQVGIRRTARSLDRGDGSRMQPRPRCRVTELSLRRPSLPGEERAHEQPQHQEQSLAS